MFFFATVEHTNPIFELFENNLFNWLVLVALLIYMGSRILPGVLAARKERIAGALEDAALARSQGQAFLTEQKQKIANAEKEAETILVEARQIADTMREEMDAQTQKSMVDLRAKIEQDITNQRQMAITQLRAAAGRAAIVLAESELSKSLNDTHQKKLVSDFLGQLEASKSNS